MATVVRRNFRSSPYRDALVTWQLIVDLLTATNSDARSELESVNGIASSIIADKASEKSAIFVSCDGPQTRIYCLFDDDAIDGSDANEDVLTFDALKGDWLISLPCTADDLTWVRSALKEKSDRITARDLNEKKYATESASKADTGLELDVEEFLGS